MRKVRVSLTNFSFGEVSPSMFSRTDTAIYLASAQRMRDYYIRSEGGAIKRDGGQNVYKFDTTYNANKKMQHRLVDFDFSDDEKYIVSIEHQKIRVFIIDPTTGDISLADTITQDVNAATLLFDDDDLHKYTVAQTGDVMFICYTGFLPQQLVRTGLETFQVEPFAFDARRDGSKTFQPYSKFMTAGTTLTASATTGSVTLTTSAGYFTSDHVGKTLRIGVDAEATITAYSSSTSVTATVAGTIEHRLIVNALRTRDGSTAVKVTHIGHGFTGGETITIAEASACGGITAANINGARTIASIRDEDTYIITAGAAATSAEDGGGAPLIQTGAATTEWSEQSFSEIRGFPGAVTFHENRLVFAGTQSQPDGIWTSKSARYYNFDVGIGADSDSIQISGTVGVVNQIRHLVSNRDLQIFGGTDEFYIPAFGNQPLTPTNARVIRQTPYGSTWAAPVVVDGATVFLQKNRKTVREYVFTDQEAAYIAPDISALSYHLVPQTQQLAALRGATERNESYVFCVRSNGKMAVFNSNRAAERAGWTLFTPANGGLFRSVCVVDDRAFATIVMDPGGGTESEYLVDLTSDFNLDLGKTYTGVAGVFDVSADFDNGAVLDVVVGNYYYGQFTVTTGDIDVSSINATLTEAEIGFGVIPLLRTNPIDANVGFGQMSGFPRGIGSVILDVVKTLSANVNGTKVRFRNVTDDLSEEPSKFTGKKEVRLLGYGRDPQVEITQDEPLAQQINGMNVELSYS